MHLPCVEPPAEEPAEAPAPHDEPPALLPPVPAILQPCSGVARRAGPCMLAAHHIRGGHGLGSCCALASSHGRDGLSGGPATQTWVLEDLPAHVSAIPVRWECTRKTEAFHLRARWNASRRGW